MAEFKKGDRIVFTKDDSWWERGGTEMPRGTLGTYDDAPGEGAPWVRLDTGERVRAWAARIAPAEDHGTGDGSASDICAEPGCNCDLERRFPAPLDPSKVKAGDTVTVTDGKHTVTGVVDSVRERAAQLWFRFRFGEQPDAYYEVPIPGGFGEAFTLIAHQPAPEPEPAPGYYAVHPTANPEAVWTGLVFEDGSFVGEEDGFYRSASKGEFSVSERLVVIDPAAARQSLEDNGWGGQWAAAVLEHLGLEGSPS